MKTNHCLRKFSAGDICPALYRGCRVDCSEHHSGADTEMSGVPGRVHRALEWYWTFAVCGHVFANVASSSVRRLDFVSCGMECASADSQICQCETTTGGV